MKYDMTANVSVVMSLGRVRVWKIVYYHTYRLCWADSLAQLEKRLSVADGTELWTFGLSDFFRSRSCRPWRDICSINIHVVRSGFKKYKIEIINKGITCCAPSLSSVHSKQWNVIVEVKHFKCVFFCQFNARRFISVIITFNISIFWWKKVVVNSLHLNHLTDSSFHNRTIEPMPVAHGDR